MRRQRTSVLAFAVALAAAAVPTAAQAQTQLAGSYTLNAQASDDVRAAINSAVARMNFVTRPIARGRLVRTNPAYGRITFAFPADSISIRFDARNPIVTPANGTPIRWTREDGEVFQVSTEWENGRLEQTYRAEDGQRLNVYTLSADRNTLTLEVTLNSPRLPEPLRYRLVYNRAQ